MLGWNGVRRWAAFAGVALAGFASIATSQHPSWSLDDRIEGLGARLDTNAPESVQHFTVSSSQSHDIRVTGNVVWDVDEADPQAAVLVRIEADSGGAAETTLRAADVDGEELSFDLSLNRDCAAATCDEGYTVRFQLVDGWPTEHVDASWSVAAEIGGDSPQEPEDAFVTITQD